MSLVSSPQQPSVTPWRDPRQPGSRLALGLGKAGAADCLGCSNSAHLTEVLSLLCVDQGQLLSISAAYGDLETVRYLLTERRVELPTEPTDDNPAVVAAHFGHTDVVQELLESLPGKSQALSSLRTSRESPLLRIRQTFVGGGWGAWGWVWAFLFLDTFTKRENQISGPSH